MIVGIDIGYGYTKAVGEEGEVIFPSVVGKAERIRYETDVRPAGSAEGVRPSDAPRQWGGPLRPPRGGAGHGGNGIALITEEGGHFVGELALLQSRVQWALLDRSRVEDPSTRLLFLAALSQLNRLRSQAEEEEGTTEFRVVTGLPVKWYADRDKVVRQLGGKHLVRRVNGRGEGSPTPRGRGTPVQTSLPPPQWEVHRFSVSDVLVVPQPFGSLFNVILGPEGQLVDEDLARSRVAVIDVGTYTTDYVLVDRLRYIERGSGTISTAMSKAYQLIGRSILDTFGLDMRMHEVDEAVREGQVTVFGEDRNIDWLVSPVLDALSQEVLAEAGTLWGDGRDLKAILVTGGGAMALGERICARYAHTRVLDDATLANARGFLKYGRRKWKPAKGQDASERS